jgi:hypothetical protein
MRLELVLETDMRTHQRTTWLIVAALLLTPASALMSQDRGGVPTETQARQNQRFDEGLLWNILGLLGLFGVLGLRRGHAEDSYHPAAFE